MYSRNRIHFISFARQLDCFCRWFPGNWNMPTFSTFTPRHGFFPPFLKLYLWSNTISVADDSSLNVCRNNSSFFKSILFDVVRDMFLTRNDIADPKYRICPSTNFFSCLRGRLRPVSGFRIESVFFYFHVRFQL